MTPTRVALLVLVILAVFFLLVLWSVEGDDSSYGNFNDFRQRFKPPSWSRTAFQLLGPFSPRLELEQPIIVVKAGRSSDIRVSPSSWPFRRAAWVLKGGARARIEYTAPSSAIEDLRVQELQLPGSEPGPQSLALLASGGTITISCQGALDCLVQLVD